MPNLEVVVGPALLTSERSTLHESRPCRNPAKLRDVFHLQRILIKNSFCITNGNAAYSSLALVRHPPKEPAGISGPGHTGHGQYPFWCRRGRRRAWQFPCSMASCSSMKGDVGYTILKKPAIRYVVSTFQNQVACCCAAHVNDDACKTTT